MAKIGSEKWGVRELLGVNSFLDEVNIPDSMASWCCGGFPNNQGDIERVPGKLLASTNQYGPVLALKELNFKDSDSIVVHAGTAHWWVENPPFSPTSGEDTPIDVVI